MNAVRMLVALSAATLASACANPGATSAAPATPAATGMAHAGMGSAGSMAAADPRMKAMQEMHQKMMNAKTPAERQALMADHMKAMQGGMAMMKDMHGKHSESAMTGMAPMGSASGASTMSGMSEGKGEGMTHDMAEHHRMMADHMATMQMMMDMMADRMPAAPATQ
jgi:hypothetical protein